MRSEVREVIKLNLETIYTEMVSAYEKTQRCEAQLKDASDRGAAALEAIRAARLSRAYQKTQMLATMYLVQLDREHDLT